MLTAVPAALLAGKDWTGVEGVTGVTCCTGGTICTAVEVGATYVDLVVVLLEKWRVGWM